MVLKRLRFQASDFVLFLLLLLFTKNSGNRGVCPSNERNLRDRSNENLHVEIVGAVMLSEGH